MPRLLTLGASLAVLGTLAVAPAALADSTPPAPSSFHEVATSSAYTQGQEFSDSAGNRYYQDSIYTGSVAGSPINGSFRIDVNFFYPAGSSSGSMAGSFVENDGSGNAIFGALSGMVSFASSGQATDSGRFQILGGTGSYLHERGSGTFTGSVTNGGQSVTATFAGNQHVGKKANDSRPGKGLGDRNHTHGGPKGLELNESGDD